MKRILSFVIVMAVILGMLPVMSVASSAITGEHIEIDESATSYTDGDGITYKVVRTVTDFKNITHAKGSNYILANDISLENESFDTPVFADGSAFTGILNGNGYAVYNFSADYTGSYGTTGLIFQSLKNNAKIINLSIGKQGSLIQYTLNGANVTVAGGIVGKIHEDTAADDTVTISNVDVYCNITFNKVKNAGVSIGGFIGITEGSNSYNVSISDSSFTGSISFSQNAAVSGQNTRVGGLVGYHKNGSLSASGYSNNANIDTTNRTSLTSGNHSYAGGLVGYAEAGATFTDCTNAGNIVSDIYSGGIVARAAKSTSFTRCTNTGSVTSALYSGGILGAVNFSSTSDQIFDFYNCVNNGDVSAVAGDTDEYKTTAGGIIGMVNFGSYTVSGCGNTGDISAGYLYDTSGIAKLGACGIIGRYYVNSSDTSITDCYSVGNISSTLNNDTREYKVYAICTGSVNEAATTLTVSDCIWDMSFGEQAVNNGVAANLSDASANNVSANLLTKLNQNDFEARIQKSDDNTKIRVLILSNTQSLDPNNDITVTVMYGTAGKRFTIDASLINPMDCVDAAGETYFAVGGEYIFGAVIKDIPETVMEQITDITVAYGDFSYDFDME